MRRHDVWHVFRVVMPLSAAVWCIVLIPTVVRYVPATGWVPVVMVVSLLAWALLLGAELALWRDCRVKRALAEEKRAVTGLAVQHFEAWKSGDMHSLDEVESALRDLGVVEVEVVEDE